MEGTYESIYCETDEYFDDPNLLQYENYTDYLKDHKLSLIHICGSKRDAECISVSSLEKQIASVEAER